MLDIYLFDEGGDASADSSAAVGTSDSGEGVATQDGWAKAKEQFHDDYSKEMSEAIQKRLSKSKEKEAELNARISQFEALQKSLAKRYGTDDLLELDSRVRNDESWIKAEADRRGMSVEATKLQMELEYRDAQERERNEAIAREAKIQADVLRWRGEERELQKTFPNYVLDEEFENPRFYNLLTNGWSVGDAYEAVHAKELIQGSMQHAYEKGRENLSSSIQANANRPTSNGVSSQGANITQYDFKKMTDEEFDKFREDLRAGRVKLPS